MKKKKKEKMFYMEENYQIIGGSKCNGIKTKYKTTVEYDNQIHRKDMWGLSQTVRAFSVQ